MLTPEAYQRRHLQRALFPEGKRNLILKRVSRLDAFSAYLNRT